MDDSYHSAQLAKLKQRRIFDASLQGTQIGATGDTRQRLLTEARRFFLWFFKTLLNEFVSGIRFLHPIELQSIVYILT